MSERKETTSEELNDDPETFSQFFGTAKELLQRYTHCSQCGANLHFTHITDFSKNLTQEVTRCPECGLRGRRLIHRLH